MRVDASGRTEADARASQDLDLVRRTLAGDLAAVEEWLERLGCVRRFLAAKNASLGRRLSSDELEDTIQNTLLALWKKRDTFAGYGSLEAWAYRFSCLEWLNRLQLLRQRPRSLEEPELENENELAARPDADPFEYERLYLALERIEEPAVGLLRSKHLDALTFEEIATRDGVSANTVKTRYYRALEKLRALLTTRGGVEVMEGTP
jgi:RNA polymerase sigma-70 factor (ECF subfamily)